MLHAPHVGKMGALVHLETGWPTARSGNTRLETLSQPLRRRRDEYRHAVAAVQWLPLGDDRFAFFHM